MLGKFLDRLGVRLLTTRNRRVMVLEPADSVLLIRKDVGTPIAAILDSEDGIQSAMILNAVVAMVGGK